MNTSLIRTISGLAGAVFLVSASIVSASIEPGVTTQEITIGNAKDDRLTIPGSPKSDLLPVAHGVKGNKGLVFAYRMGPRASIAVPF